MTGVVLHPSHQLLRRKSLAVGHVRVREHHTGVAALSPSAKWYMDTTGYELLALPRELPRRAEVLLHRLRLDYRCVWQVIPSVSMEERVCEHCGAPSATLVHYLQECEHTSFLRRGPPTTPAGLVKRLCLSPTQWSLDHLVARPPPR